MLCETLKLTERIMVQRVYGEDSKRKIIIDWGLFLTIVGMAIGAAIWIIAVITDTNSTVKFIQQMYSKDLQTNSQAIKEVQLNDKIQDAKIQHNDQEIDWHIGGGEETHKGQHEGTR